MVSCRNSFMAKVLDYEFKNAWLVEDSVKEGGSKPASVAANGCYVIGGGSSCEFVVVIIILSFHPMAQKRIGSSSIIRAADDNNDN